MGTWNENKETRLDKLLNLVKSCWKAIAIVLIVCIAAKMDFNDQARAEAMVALFYGPKPDCHDSVGKDDQEPHGFCRPVKSQ